MNREDPWPRSVVAVRLFFYGGLPWWCGLLAVQVPVVVRILLLEQILVMVEGGERRKKEEREKTKPREERGWVVAPSGIDPLTSRFSVVRSTN